jgi:hypothetical protein
MRIGKTSTIPKYYSSQMSAPDESGTTNLQYQSINPDVTYHPGADSPYGLYNDQFGAINWRPTDNPNGIKSPDGVTGYVKPDDMYDYNNLYYDDKYGLVRDIRDYRDPNAKQNGWIDAAIMAAVGGVGGMAASAANAAAGGASFMGVQAPSHWPELVSVLLAHLTMLPTPENVLQVVQTQPQEPIMEVVIWL